MPVLVLPTLPPPENPAGQAEGTPPLPVWALTCIYDEDMGLRQAPVCGPKGTPSRFNRVHGGKCTKIVKWVAVGWGAKPPLPDWDTGSDNEVLLRRLRTLNVPGKGPDGADVAIYAGEYHYGLQWPLDDLDELTGGAGPYQTDPKAITVFSLTPGDFQAMWVGPSVPPAALQALLDKTPAGELGQYVISY